MLDALREHSTDAERAALALVAAVSPAGIDPAAPRPPPPAQSALLASAVVAAALALVAQAADERVPVMAVRLGPGEHPALAQLLDAVLWLAAQSPALVDLALPAACIEAVLEATPNTECGAVFAALDARTAAFQHPVALYAKSKHALLRTCTLLLARLSKSQDAVLCGRVLSFLAKFMPLTEPSGLNRGGAFNTANVTPVEEVAEGAVDAEGRPVDAAFYNIFWGLQAWFANPPAVLSGAKWPEVSRCIAAVLDRLERERVTVSEAPAGRSGRGGGEGSVKYLSSARLLPLQLRDATFRRHFLVQCLVLMAWCEAPQLKDWAARALKGKSLEDLQALRARVYAALGATPERGERFAAAVRALLDGEGAWAAWKAALCPKAPLEVAPAVAPPGAADAEVAPPRKRRKPSSEAVFGVTLGTDELDRLWNLTEDNTSGESNHQFILSDLASCSVSSPGCG